MKERSSNTELILNCLGLAVVLIIMSSWTHIRSQPKDLFKTHTGENGWIHSLSENPTAICYFGSQTCCSTDLCVHVCVMTRAFNCCNSLWVTGHGDWQTQSSISQQISKKNRSRRVFQRHQRQQLHEPHSCNSCHTDSEMDIDSRGMWKLHFKGFQVKTKYSLKWLKFHNCNLCIYYVTCRGKSCIVGFLETGDSDVWYQAEW